MNSTGEIRDDRQYMSMLEDFCARREGDQRLQLYHVQRKVDDIKYFQKKLINLTKQIRTGSLQLGKSTEVNRDEIKFTKFISRLRNI